MHASDKAQLSRAEHNDNDRLAPTQDPKFNQHPAVVEPGSYAESVALTLIDDRRYEEQLSLDETFSDRRRKAVRHWRRSL